MIKTIAALFGCAMTFSAFSQITITGTVLDAKTKEPLAGATVQTETQNRYAVTNELGKFELKNVPSGKANLIARFLGYDEFKQEVNANENQQVEFLLQESSQLTDEIVVTATRANEKSPTVFSTLSKATIQKQNLGQDIPFLLNWTPSLVATSDAGTGIGYTGLRIRGSDATRINVTINGISLNESDEHGVFWVDVPDIATSTQSIQIQRGVGSSTNGAGAFGASINLQTNTRNDLPYADILNSGGSFGTHRHTMGVGTGLKNNFAFDARVSLINSDGFVDRGTADLKSYYLSAGYYGKKTFVKAILFGGQEITYQSWNGVPESKLTNDAMAMDATIADGGWNAEQIANFKNSNARTFNLYTYKNQVDNYGQYHYQLHTSHRFNDEFTGNISLHYTKGGGYYEEYKYDAPLTNYGLDTFLIGSNKIGSTDLVRRRWLETNFYGLTYSLQYENKNATSILGGAINRHTADRFGEIIWAQVSNVPKDFRYYFNTGNKTDFNIFWKTNYQISERVNAFVDLQYRGIVYNASGMESQSSLFKFLIDNRYDFFNPKLGLTYSINGSQNLYASYSIANREPVRSDFISSANPQSERLYNIEAGWRYKNLSKSLNVNYYLMDYTNQLVLTGALNDVGASVRTNVPNSYRMGIEVDGGIRFNQKFSWIANITLSQNKIRNYSEALNNYDTGTDSVRSFSNTDIAFSPNLIAGSNFSYHPIPAFEITLLSKYVGKQFLDNTSSDKRKIDAYVVNDLRLTYTLRPNFMKELSLSCLVNNIFNEVYSSNGYTYGYFYGGEVRQNYYYPQAGRNFLVMLAMRF